jgi:hypothetical protein
MLINFNQRKRHEERRRKRGKKKFTADFTDDTENTRSSNFNAKTQRRGDAKGRKDFYHGGTENAKGDRAVDFNNKAAKEREENKNLNVGDFNAETQRGEDAKRQKRERTKILLRISRMTRTKRGRKHCPK